MGMIMSFFCRIDRDRFRWLIASEVSATTTLEAFPLPGGKDLHPHYVPFSQSCLDHRLIRYLARWILWLLGLVPPRPVVVPMEQHHDGRYPRRLPPQFGQPGRRAVGFARPIRAIDAYRMSFIAPVAAAVRRHDTVPIQNVHHRGASTYG